MFKGQAEKQKSKHFYNSKRFYKKRQNEQHTTKASGIFRNSSRKLKLPTKDLGIQLLLPSVGHCKSSVQLQQNPSCCRNGLSIHEDRAVWTALISRSGGVIVLRPAPLTTPGPFSPPLGVVAGHFLDSPTRAKPFTTRDGLPCLFLCGCCFTGSRQA
jgi:hypothetical protein